MARVSLIVVMPAVVESDGCGGKGLKRRGLSKKGGCRGERRLSRRTFNAKVNMLANFEN